MDRSEPEMDETKLLVAGSHVDVLQLVKQELSDPDYEKSWKVKRIQTYLTREWW